MPVYNAGNYVQQAIESILCQSYTNWELLVCDDNSQDNSLSILESFRDPRIKIYSNKTNLKKPKTVNKLFGFAKGQYITIHDADDISDPLRFEKQINQLESSSAIFCGCNIEYISEGGKRLNIIIDKKKYEQDDFPRYGDATIIVKKPYIENEPIFRDYFKNNMDYDLGLRLLDKGEYTNVDESLYFYRNVFGSVSKSYQNPKNLVYKWMAFHFASQRRSGIKDDLELGAVKKINDSENEIIKNLTTNPYQYEIEIIYFLVSIKMYQEALKINLIAIKRYPFFIPLYKSIFKIFLKWILQR